MSEFEVETALAAVDAGRPTHTAGPVRSGVWTTRLSAAWNIADHSNGGYALSPVLRAMRTLVPHADPISVTTHFLRPAQGDADADVHASVVRSGRSVSTLRGSLWQQGTQRLEMLAAFADLPAPHDNDGSGREGGSRGLEIAEHPPTIPPVEDCIHRTSLDQGLVLPILSRVDIRVHPDHAPAGGSGRALIDGWIRFKDGTEPSTLALPLFADALPPSLYPLLGSVGWVPTVELTVHARRVPAPGWLRVRFESHDLHGGRMIESGSLWDSSGALVACSRQLGLLLT